jgi:hypothetical protein
VIDFRSIGGTEKHPKALKNKVPYRRPYRQRPEFGGSTLDQESIV